MKNEVIITIRGLQSAQDDEDSIEVLHIGEYYERNGTHYILFDELLEGSSHPVKNIIKIKEHYLEVQKKGAVAATMVFDEGKSRNTMYQTPYGDFLITTYTLNTDFHIDENKLEAAAAYKLILNGEHHADCNIRIKAEPRENFRLRGSE